MHTHKSLHAEPKWARTPRTLPHTPPPELWPGFCRSACKSNMARYGKPTERAPSRVHRRRSEQARRDSAQGVGSVERLSRRVLQSLLLSTEAHTEYRDPSTHALFGLIRSIAEPAVKGTVHSMLADPARVLHCHTAARRLACCANCLPLESYNGNTHTQ